MTLSDDVLQRLEALFGSYADKGCSSPVSRITCGEVAALLKELQQARNKQPKLPSFSQRVTVHFLASILKEIKADPDCITMSADSARKLCEELLARRRIDEMCEPVAWLTEDGCMIHHAVKDKLTPRVSRDFAIPLYRAITVRQADILERMVVDDPLAAHRWICPFCTTTNALTDDKCTGCQHPKITL